MSAAFIGGRGSVTLYLCCHPVCHEERRCYRYTRESERERKKQDKESRHRRGARLGLVCKHRRWRIPIATHAARTTIHYSFDTCIPKLAVVKPSNRIAKKAIEHSLLGLLNSTIGKSNLDSKESVNVKMSHVLYKKISLCMFFFFKKKFKNFVKHKVKGI